MKRPILIGIGASHSGTGKTFIASSVLRFFTDDKSPNAGKYRFGAIKYTRSSVSSEIVTDRTILMQEGKDTWKLLTSGASDVVWVSSGRRGLQQTLLSALERLNEMDIVIIEGNSAIEFLKPDIVVFILGRCRRDWKAGIEKFLLIADFVLCDTGIVVPGICHAKVFNRDISDGKFLSALELKINERRVEKGNVEPVCRK